MYTNDEVCHEMTCEALNCVYGTYTMEELAHPDYDEICGLMGWENNATTRDIIDSAIEIAIDLKTNKY